MLVTRGIKETPGIRRGLSCHAQKCQCHGACTLACTTNTSVSLTPVTKAVDGLTGWYHKILLFSQILCFLVLFCVFSVLFLHKKVPNIHFGWFEGIWGGGVGGNKGE